MKYFLSYTKFFLVLVIALPIRAQNIVNQSDLVFPAAEPDSPAYTVLPGSTDTAENASFLITGTAFTSYSISLPKSAQMENTEGSGKIRVTNFTSNPAEGNNGLLNSSGEQWLYVGATRAKLTNNQSPGLYSIAFVVTVIY
jgi:hypothetical protein